MEWLDQFKGKIVGLDTAPLIYFIEQNPDYLKIVGAFFRSLARGEFRVKTYIVSKGILQGQML